MLIVSHHFHPVENKRFSRTHISSFLLFWPKDKQFTLLSNYSPSLISHISIAILDVNGVSSSTCIIWVVYSQLKSPYLWDDCSFVWESFYWYYLDFKHFCSNQSFWVAYLLWSFRPNSHLSTSNLMQSLWFMLPILRLTVVDFSVAPHTHDVSILAWHCD